MLSMISIIWTDEDQSGTTEELGKILRSLSKLYGFQYMANMLDQENTDSDARDFPKFTRVERNECDKFHALKR